ncbi:MAG: type II toxin-antitoxin system VapB family antitoxin [Vicinamibacterales bacterium]
MRTNIDIDDDLVREAMRASGATTKRAAVEQGLSMLIQVRGQCAIRQLRGKVKWTGDLNASRLDRTSSER